MRTINRFFIPLCTMLLVVMVTFTALAQDEVYDTPNYDENLIEYNNQQFEQTPLTNRNNRDEVLVSNNVGVDGDQEYVFYDDNEYEYRYASRIRRFNNARVGSSYYSPFYVDRYWYTRNPDFWGQSIYTSPAYAYNPYVANNWGWGNSNSFYRTSSWYNVSPWRSPFNTWNNNWAFNPYAGVNSFNYGAYNAFYGNPYCPTNYVSTTYISNSNNDSNNANSYYGARPGRGAVAGSATQGISTITNTKTGTTSGKNTNVRTPRNGTTTTTTTRTTTTTTRGTRTRVDGGVRGNVRTSTTTTKPQKRGLLKRIFGNNNKSTKNKSYRTSRSSSSKPSYSRSSRSSRSSSGATYRSSGSSSSKSGSSRRGSRK